VRNVARIKLGYYPLPLAEGARLRSLLEFAPGASALDRSWHREVHTALRRGIASRYNDPTLWQLVFAQPAIQHQLITSCLRHLRRGG
jgi:hypothetical protein